MFQMKVAALNQIYILFHVPLFCTVSHFVGNV